MTNKEYRERYKKYVKIAERAEKEGLYHDDRQSLLMDIESADRKFNLRLDDWLKADEFNFAHDLYGIVDNIVRNEFPATKFKCFVPRFAGEREE
jgi:hypothetical protein